MSTPTTVTLSATTTVTVSSASVTGTSRATPQGGILEHIWPNAYSPTDPLKLFIIQASIIIIFCRLLHWPLSRIGQPRVIAEVIGGILLGPSVMSRIPGFKDAIFPDASMPVITNVANLGLVLYLFIIALEVDMRLFTHNWRIAAAVSFTGMALPFGLGIALAKGLYENFQDPNAPPVSFGVFALFVGTALAITAFPVLCRILSELNLLGASVGVTVLAAGVGNDVVGWILLALCVALVNNSSGLAALWVLLAGVAWVLFLVFLVKPVFWWILKRTGSLRNGPTQGMVALTVLLVIISAWFTDMIGIHPIFGAFLVGLICPHDGGFAIKVTEKIEDLISVLFLPLYFALSGLNTNLGLLNDGYTWGYVIAILVVAFSGKIIGGTLAARASKLVWRESFTIGVLMSCKGLVELIVLNVGLQANILTKQTFTMFVVMALITTFATTPLVKWLYPPSYQRKLEAWKRGEIEWDGTPTDNDNVLASESLQQLQDPKIHRLMVYLRLDCLPSLFTLVSLLGAEARETGQEESKEVTKTPDATDGPRIPKRPLQVHALRMLELTDRTSSVMKVTESEEYVKRDPVMNAFQTFSSLHDVAISGDVVVAPEESYADTVTTQASNHECDFLLIPWSEVGSNTDDQAIPHQVSAENRFSGRSHLDFISSALSKAVVNTGIFIGNGFSGIAPVNKAGQGLPRTISHISMRSSKDIIAPIADKTHHVFLPFIGGADDRVALRFALQLARSPNITLSIVHLYWGSDSSMAAKEEVSSDAQDTPTETKNAINTEVTVQDLALLSSVRKIISRDATDRINLTDVSVDSHTAAHTASELAREKVGLNPRNAGDIVVVGRRHAKFEGTAVAKNATNPELMRIFGVLGDRMVCGTPELKASVLVVQAAGRGLEW